MLLPHARSLDAHCRHLRCCFRLRGLQPRRCCGVVVNAALPQTPPAFTLSPLSARATLLGVALCWGVYNPTLRIVYAFPNAPSPGELSAARLAIALLPFLPTLFLGATQLWSESESDAAATPADSEAAASASGEAPDWSAITRASLELGTYNLCGTAGQAWGLSHTTAVHAAVLLSSINVFVPVGAAISGEPVRPSTVVAATLVLLGIALLNGWGAGEGAAAVAAHAPSAVPLSPEDELYVALGDAAVLAAAVSYATYTVRLGAFAKRLPSLPLAAGKTLVLALGCFAWAAAERAAGAGGGDGIDPGGGDESVLWSFLSHASQAAPPPSPAGSRPPSPSDVSALAWAAVAFSALVPGSAATWLQARGQSGVSSSEAQVILALTPLVSVSVAAAFLGEPLGGNVLAAGAVMLSATALCLVDAARRESVS